MGIPMRLSWLRSLGNSDDLAGLFPARKATALHPLNDEQTACALFNPHTTGSLQLLKAPPSYRLEPGERKQLLMPVSTLRFTWFIGDGNKQPFRHQLEKVRKHPVHIRLGEVLQDM